MDNVYIISLIIPPAVFLGSFFTARQFRALQNVPSISAIFVQRKWLVSILMGLPFSGIFSLVIFSGTGFSARNIFIVAAIFSIASVSSYFGLTLGWGQPLSANEDVTPPDQPPANALPDGVTIEDMSHSIKITIIAYKRWRWFVIALFNWVLTIFLILPIVGFVIVAILLNFLPENVHFLVWGIAGGAGIYFAYVKFRETLEYISDTEIIEIDNSSIKVEQHGSGFTNKKEYPANNINRISTLLSGRHKVIKRSPFINSNMPVFIIWHNRGLKRYHSFGRGIDVADAQNILEIIYARFPQYKG